MADHVKPSGSPSGCVLRRGCLDPGRCSLELRCCIDDIRAEERDDFDMAYAEYESGRRFARLSDDPEGDMPW